jgi:hypothetical protein
MFVTFPNDLDASRAESGLLFLVRDENSGARLLRQRVGHCQDAFPPDPTHLQSTEITQATMARPCARRRGRAKRAMAGSGASLPPEERIVRKSLGLIVFVTLVGCVASSDAVLGRDYDWMSRDQMSALSGLAAGYAGGLCRDRLVDATVAGAFLTKTFGGRPFSAQEVAELCKMISGVVAAQAIAVGRADLPSCATVRKYFGPGGSRIPGLLDQP